MPDAQRKKKPASNIPEVMAMPVDDVTKNSLTPMLTQPSAAKRTRNSRKEILNVS